MAQDSFNIDDSVGAWAPHGRFEIGARGDGPLSGLRFAAKDLFDVAGQPTGAGNPDWLATHPTPDASSSVIDRLLDAGATLAGKTLTDELAYSIHGDNMHYGMPLNSAAPDRIPGGSSSGSVAAVAAQLVDFALGTDTGGSTRVPASYCGVWGLRTTHDLIARDGLVALHPGFDTVTWLAHDAPTFVRVGAALLPDSDYRPRQVLVFEDAAEQADAHFAPLIDALAAATGEYFGTTPTPTRISGNESLEQWRKIYTTAGAYQAWQTHGHWITTTQPHFAPAIAARWQAASQVSAAHAEAADAAALAIRRRVQRLIGADTIAIVPSAASIAPLRSAASDEIDAIRMRTQRICCIAGLGGLPQVNVPLRNAQGIPCGVSLIGPPGSDLELIRYATALSAPV